MDINGAYMNIIYVELIDNHMIDIAGFITS